MLLLLSSSYLFIYLLFSLSIQSFIGLFVWYRQATNVYTAFDVHYESEQEAQGRPFMTAAQRHAQMKVAVGWLLQVIYTCYFFSFICFALVENNFLAASICPAVLCTVF